LNISRTAGSGVINVDADVDDDDDGSGGDGGHLSTKRSAVLGDQRSTLGGGRKLVRENRLRNVGFAARLIRIGVWEVGSRLF